MENNSVLQTPTSEELAAVIKELRDCEKKNLKINRIRLIILSVCLLICIVTAIYTFRNLDTLIIKTDTAVEVLTEAGNNFNALSTELEKMNLEKLGKSLNNIVDISEQTIIEIQKAVGGLDSLVTDADEAMKHINSVNFEDLNNGIQRLNDVLEPIANFFNFLK